VRAYDDAEIARLASLGLTPESDPTVAVDGPGPTLFFQEVPESKPAKNRLHLDIDVADRADQVERLTASGATVVDHFDTWTVLRDPEGNEFCLTDLR
jgi:predicted enzyme related to lactoylglutathione lyase